MKFRVRELAGILALFLLFTYFAAAGQVQAQVSDKVLRLHVIANSDTKEDQALKLQVRDAVLQVAAEASEDCTTTEETRQALESHLREIEKTAQKVVRRAGYDYSVTAQIKREYYPSKTYKNFALPAGDYTGLKVKIGKAAGHNWWCVVFPPLCTSAATKESFVGFQPEEIAFVQQDGTRYAVRFKAAEWVDTLRHTLGEPGEKAKK